MSFEILVLGIHSVGNVYILEARTLYGAVKNNVRAYAEVDGTRVEILIKLPAMIRPKPGNPEPDFGTFTIERPDFDASVLIGKVLCGVEDSDKSRV